MLEILINNNSNCYNNNNSHNNNYYYYNNNSNYDNYKLEKNSNCWTCSPSPTTLDLIFSITYEHYWILATKKMICHWVSLFQTMQILIISDCCVEEHGLWNAQSLKTHVMSYCSSPWSDCQFSPLAATNFLVNWLWEFGVKKKSHCLPDNFEWSSLPGRLYHTVMRIWR